jgi:hypothetical protein
MQRSQRMFLDRNFSLQNYFFIGFINDLRIIYFRNPNILLTKKKKWGMAVFKSCGAGKISFKVGLSANYPPTLKQM